MISSYSHINFFFFFFFFYTFMLFDKNYNGQEMAKLKVQVKYTIRCLF